MGKEKNSFAANSFDLLADTSLVTIQTASLVSSRSRNSIYRHFKAGDLTPIKIGHSTRIRVSELRVLMGVQK